MAEQREKLSGGRRVLGNDGIRVYLDPNRPRVEEFLDISATEVTARPRRHHPSRRARSSARRTRRQAVDVRTSATSVPTGPSARRIIRQDAGSDPWLRQATRGHPEPFDARLEPHRRATAEIGPDQLVYVDRRNNVLKLSQGEFVTVSKLEAAYGGHPSVRQIFVYGNSAGRICSR